MSKFIIIICYLIAALSVVAILVKAYDTVARIIARRRINKKLQEIADRVIKED